MRFFILMLIFFGATESFAAIEWVRLKESTAVYKSDQDSAQLLVMANAGEKVAVRSRGRDFARIQIKRGGKWRVGYIRLSEIDYRRASEDGWGFGGGLGYAYLRQAARQFETGDQVNYSLGVSTSTAISPVFVAQNAREDFWRIIVAYRLVDISSQQTTDVALTRPTTVNLKYSMISGAIQKMWNFNRTFYGGLGIEAGKAISASLKIGDSKLTVDNSTLPNYIGGHAAIGFQSWITSTMSAFVEVRAMGYFNQSPMVFGTEGVLGLIYWP